MDVWSKDHSFWPKKEKRSRLKAVGSDRRQMLSGARGFLFFNLTELILDVRFSPCRLKPLSGRSQRLDARMDRQDFPSERQVGWGRIGRDLFNAQPA